MNLMGVLSYRTHMQTVIDCSVYSGSVIQGKGLNGIARQNREIVRLLRDYASRPSKAGIYGSLSSGNAAVNNYRSIFQSKNESLRQDQNRINQRTQGDAVAAARDIAGRNDHSAQLTCWPNPRGQLASLIDTPSRSESYSFRYWKRTRYGWIIRSSSGTFGRARLFRKDASTHTYFSGKVLRARLPWIFAGRAFSGGAPDIASCATAMPAGGNLWDGNEARAKYRAKLVRGAYVNPRPPSREAWDW